MYKLPVSSTKSRRALLVAGLALICGPHFPSTGAAMGKSPPTPPLALPFPIHKAGSKIEFDMRIVEDRSYRFLIAFIFKTQEERKRVMELVGDPVPGTFRDRNGVLVRLTQGVMVPIHLTVYSIGKAGTLELLKDERYETQAHERFGAESFDRFIGSVGLSPGVYRVVVQTLKDTPEFARVETRLSVYTRHH
jgi:hypothetical protein